MEIKRKIPATMATEHKDNAAWPDWLSDGSGGCIAAFSKIGCEEFFWDCSIKQDNDADGLLEAFHDFFKKNPIGRQIFLTFGIPESFFRDDNRMLRALMQIMIFNRDAAMGGLEPNPVFEVILPVGDEPGRLVDFQQSFQKLTGLKKDIFKNNSNDIAVLDYINAIPMVDDTDQLFEYKDILNRYINDHSAAFYREPEHIRAVIGRSMPALKTGMVAAVLAAKAAISQLGALQKERQIPIYPIIEAGSLPFRGGLTPKRVDDFIKLYAGARSATIQPAFRYDYAREEAGLAVEILGETLSASEPCIFDDQFLKVAKRIATVFRKHYIESLHELAGKICNFSSFVPDVEKGFWAYTPFKLRKRVMPGPIPFTAALYSVGIPPEIIGVGRALKEVMQDGMIDELFVLYPIIKQDLVHACHFLNTENLDLLLDQDSAWKEIKMDLMLLENLLDIDVGPKEINHYLHRNLTSSIFLLWENRKNVQNQFEEAAILRKSIG